MASVDVPNVLPLVAYDTATGNYRVDEQALEWLRAQHEPLGVLACAGRYRTGKSYLLNRIMGQRGAFRVGETVQACTRGIWLHRRLLRADGCAFVVIDTEGIDALDADNTHDARIFTLGLLLSSMFLYNSMGALDESSMQTLALMTKVSQCVRASAEEDSHDDVGALAEYMPHFLWVLRDFTLRLTDREGNPIEPQEYLEEALQVREGMASDRESVRRHVREAFRERSLFTLPRPAADDHIASLDSNPRYASPHFNARVSELRAFLSKRMRPMAARGSTLSGPMYAALVEHLVGEMGAEQGRVPVIRDAWSLMEEARIREAVTRALDTFRVATDALLDQSLPPKRLEEALRAKAAEVLQELEHTTRGTGDTGERALSDTRTRLVEAADVATVRTRKAYLATCSARVREVEDSLNDGSPAEEVLERVNTALRRVREEAHEPEWLAQWAVAVLQRLVDRWLPEKLRSITAARAAAEAGALRHQQALHEQQEEFEARRSADAQEAALERTSLVQDAQNQRERAEAERRRADEVDARLVAERLEAERARARLAALEAAVANESPARTAAREICDSCEAREEDLRTTRGRLAQVEARMVTVTDEAQEARDAEQRLRLQLEELRADEAQRTREFAARIDALCSENASEIAALRTEAASEVESARAEVDRLRAEGMTARLECRAIEERWEEAREATAREARRAADAEHRAQARLQDMSERVMQMHRESLEEGRARDERLRTEQDRRSSELLEAHARLSAALVEVEQCRAEATRCKRKLEDAQATEAELKRLRRSDEERTEALRRCEAELREARARREETVREREAVRSQLLESERALALSMREVHLEKARVRVGSV